MAQGLCPVCNSGRYAKIRLRSFIDDAGLRIDGVKQPTRLIVCKNCGAVRISSENLTELNAKKTNSYKDKEEGACKV